MTNTDTNNIAAIVLQIIALRDAGADVARVAVPGLKEVEALRQIKSILQQKNIDIPLVADVHFLPEVAEKTATFVEKVRINPGNFTDKRFTNTEYQQGFEVMALRAKPLIEICKKNNTAVRVGVNQGSLCERVISRYGNTPEALVGSALEWAQIAEMYDFHNIVFSIKSSHVKTMMNANLLLYNKMIAQGRVYPFHLGVTEAANEMEGRVKSAIGSGGLILKGLGNTFRVSLTENPVHEIAFSKLLVTVIKDIKDSIDSKGIGGIKGGYESQYDYFSEGILTIRYPETSLEKWWGGVGALIGKWWLTEKIKDIKIENPHFSAHEIEKLQNCALQICGIKKTHTEIIACPSCGRTQYDIQAVLYEVKQQFSHYPHLKIAVMGCVVNGPGEMADADFGIIGSAHNKVAVYKGQERISDFLPISQALQILQNKIKNNVSVSKV
jgi:(E)-4-hydroxy-3-methylbut-2-enyl-diphosphate synthase